eukprot:scaffold304846_cov31-Prasinocladus_malaysianus.AAC.1
MASFYKYVAQGFCPVHLSARGPKNERKKCVIQCLTVQDPENVLVEKTGYNGCGMLIDVFYGVGACSL